MKKPAWNKGIDHLSNEAKQLIGAATKKRIAEKGHPKGMLGKKHTLETIAKIKLWRPNEAQKKLMTHFGPRKEVSCKNCNKLMTLTPSSKAKYCSRPCVGQYFKGFSRSKNRPASVSKNCLLCNKTISQSAKLVCRPCFPKYYIGDKKSSWRGGLTSINKMVRNCDQMTIWRNAIFERDDYICQICGDKGDKLNADHYPISLSEIIITYNIKGLKDARECKELWDIKNGRTLCVPCHKTTETYGFKKHQIINEARKPEVVQI